MKTKSEIMEMIEEEGVEFIRLQFTDMVGRLKNLAVTPGQMELVLQNKYSLEGPALFGDDEIFDRELYLYPDFDSFAVLPWRPQQGKVAKLFCELHNEDGSDFEMNTRAKLKRVLADAAEDGYTFMVDPEIEFFLFHTDENGLPTTISHERAGLMDVGPADFGENARRNMVFNLTEMGFEIESSHHEKAVAQHEIDFKEDEALKMADAIHTFKFAVRSVAKQFGLYATFMPKPKSEEAGSGMHTKIAILKDGENIFDGPDGDKMAEYFIGGIVSHINAICAITNSTVNSYKRLADVFVGHNKKIWSGKGECAAAKVRKCYNGKKVELRFLDACTDSYTALCVCIAAGMEGIRNHTLINQEAHLPEDLKDAIAGLKEDDFICDLLGQEFVKHYCRYKGQEWKDYMKQVSTWEVERYLNRL